MTSSTGRGASHADSAAEYDDTRTETESYADYCVADCIADSAGGITFDITGAGSPDAVLVLRRQGVVAAEGPDSGDDEVRLPLTGAEESRLRAVLPSTVELAEGDWDVYTVLPVERPVRPGVRDVRSLADRAPGADPIAARVPYPTGKGTLAVRSWVRAPHAEAGGIRCQDGRMAVEGMLYGSALGAGAVVEARLCGGDRVHRVPVTGESGAFAFTLAYAPLAEGPVGRPLRWDLWLLPAENADGIRISRILDDIWDKRSVFLYPRHRVDGWLAAPSYTSGNDLGVCLEPA